MTAPGVEVRPLRQITGEAEFNEVFLTDVRIPDSHAARRGRRGLEGRPDHADERAGLDRRRRAAPRGRHDRRRWPGPWRQRPELRTPGMHDAVLRLWVAAEAARLAGERLRQQLAAGEPGPEGSAAEARLRPAQPGDLRLELELLGEEGLRHDDWTMRRPSDRGLPRPHAPGYRYLRAKGNSIEGGTSEILRNIIAERVLGLPHGDRVGQGRRVEGPASMSDLLYTEVEDELRVEPCGTCSADARRRWPPSGPHRVRRAVRPGAVADPGRRDGAGRPGRARALGGAGASLARGGRGGSRSWAGRRAGAVPGQSVVATAALLGRRRPTCWRSWPPVERRPRWPCRSAAPDQSRAGVTRRR